MEPKYQIGDKVKFHKDTDAEVGEVISYAYVPELKTFRYTISAKQLDLIEVKIHDAIKHCLEEELVEPGTEPKKDEVVEPEKTEEKNE